MVLPGDEIQVECFFDTTDRDEFTYWGKWRSLTTAVWCYEYAGAKTRTLSDLSATHEYCPFGTAATDAHA